MIRKIESELLNWKNKKSRKPLILRGARQVGKTFVLKQFGLQHFDNYFLFDFEKLNTIHRLFDGDLIVSDIIKELEVLINNKIIPGKTLIIFDEIQECPRALMALRYFYEDLSELHIVAAGSLLEFSMTEISFPVGRVEFLWMYPMDFGEFLLAKKEDILLEYRPTLSTSKKIPETIHNKFSKILKEYFIVGGMPEVVKTFIDSNSYIEISSLHNNLKNAFENDIPKYGTKVNKECLIGIYESIPKNLGNQIKYTSLMPNKRIESIKSVLKVLEKILIIYPVFAANPKSFPIEFTTIPNIFKQIFLDIGLARHIAGVSAKSILEDKDLLHSFKGALAEQFIGQELLSIHGKTEQKKLFYWKNSSGKTAEVDYLLIKENEVIPIEVKSGPASKLKSLKLYLDKFPNCKEGIVLHSGNFGKADRIRFLPLYTDLS